MEEITIPFRPVKTEDLQGADPGDYYQEVHDVYTGRYLEALGVQPTVKHRRYVACHAPLKECQIQAAWGVDIPQRSAVVDQLRIVQPKLEQTPTSATQYGRLDRIAQSAARDHIELVSTAMPDIPVAETLSDIVEKDRLAHSFLGVDFTSAAVWTMQMADKTASEKMGCNEMALTKELECERAHLRRASKVCDGEGNATDKEERNRLEGELTRLKRDFILPYACERPKPGAGRGTRIVPWQHLQSHQRIEVPDNLLAEALVPIKATLPEIKEEFSKFADKLPLELLTNRSDPALFDSIRGQLVFSEAVRITGLLAHLLYWVVFRHLHPEEKQLTDDSIQALQVTVHDLWSTLVAPYRDFPMGVSFVIPVLCLSIKRGIQWIFMSMFPSVFADQRLCQKLVEQINVVFMQLFDPDCAYARFGALDSTKQAVKLWKKFDLALASKGQGVATRMVMRKNRTTPAVNTLMGPECSGRPGNPKTRKLLAKSASDSVIAAGAGSSKDAAKAGSGGPRHTKKPQMDEFKQEALFKVACKQLSRPGLKALPTGPGSATASRVLERAASTSRLHSAGPEGRGRGASLNGRRRRALHVLAGRCVSPVRDKRPTTIEFLQGAGTKT